MPDHDHVMESSLSTAAKNAHRQQAVGILTKTVIRSPVCRWLLHARIRHKGLSDVVFVGEDFVYVKQVGYGGHLEHIATKIDFDARIRAAKVLSSETAPAEEELLVKQEDAKSVNGTTFAPPDILVLTLENQYLVFLWLANGDDDHPRFVQQAFPMPAFDYILFQPGEHLAIDPYSRALAVAANEREVVIYSAKTKERIRREIRNGDPQWCPVSAERPLRVEGVIQHIDFLIPPDDDRDHIILLLIVVDQRKTKAIWIDWYHTSDLHHAEIHKAQPLDAGMTVSSLLIPLRNAAFLMISGSNVTLWKDILSASLTGMALLPLEAQPKNSGNSPRQPVWASWCRPRRSRAATRDKDHIYLVREDGLVFLVHVMSDTISSSSAGHFQCHVDSAFASLGDTGDPDILAVAGDMSTGCVVSIGQWPGHRVSELSWSDTMEMELIETIPNWATMTDMVTTALGHPHSKSARSTRSSGAVLVTSGRQPYGSVTELRNGVEARLSVRLQLEGLESVTGVWAVPVATTGDVLVFLSNPSATRLLSISQADGELESSELDASECSALDLAEPTLAAAVIDDARIVQVTRQSIAVTVGLIAHFEDSSRSICDEDQQTLAAAIETTTSSVFTAEKRGERYFICSARFPSQADGGAAATSADGNFTGDSMLELSSVPSAIAVAVSSSGLLVGVTTTGGHLILVQLDASNTLREMARSMLPGAQDAPGICDHLLLLQSGDTDSILALCGLRDGRLHAVLIETDQTRCRCCGSNTLGFGQSTVKLFPMLNDRSRAYALTGIDTCLLSWDGRDACSLIVSSIWVSDKEHPELSQGPMAACAQMPGFDALNLPEELAGSTVLVSSEEVLITTQEASPATVPRRLPVGGTPTRLIYAEQQRCLVVASTKTTIRSFPTPASRPEERRQIWPTIDFIPSRSTEPSFTFDLQPGERVYALLEWSLRLSDADNEDKMYSFILVGGSYLKTNGTQGGRITSLQPTNRNWEVVDVRSREVKRFDAAVYALALYDELTFITSVGQHIMLYRFSVSADDRRWHEACVPFKLASPGIAVTVSAPLIYVSTAEDSLVTLQLRDDLAGEDGAALPTLVPVSMGPQAHESLSHLMVRSNASERLALLSTKRGQVVGLSSPSPDGDAPSHYKSADILFEARLPRSLTRIRQSDLRPKWKPAPAAGLLVDDIVGTAADGTLVGIALLDEKLWRRLFWLQRLCEWSEELSPHSHHTPVYSANDNAANVRQERALPLGLTSGSMERGDEMMLRAASGRAEDQHIDGDILARILERGGAEALKQLLTQTAEREDRVGEWIREHLDEELEAVEDMIEVLRNVLDRWI